jgi:signal transduction histidine kinase
MTGAAGPAAPAPRWVPRRWLRLPRRTVRLWLTLLYGGLFLLSGAGLLAITFALVSNRWPVIATAHGTAAGNLPGTAGSRTQVCFFAGQPGPGAATTPPPDGNCLAFSQLAAQQRATELNQLLAESGIALAIMTVVSIGLGWLVAGRVLRPLRTITAAARSISASSLHARLALAGPRDELKELGDTFDGLLARLEAAFGAQRQFVANASHELRTPLARQRTLVEVALADPEPTVAALQDVCKRVLVTGEQQERLIEALLTLARSQRGLDRREPVDLAAITDEVVLARRPEVELRGLKVAASLGPAAALGDSRLAERLVANLVDNAVRHNLAHGRIEVTTGTWDGHAVLSVSSTGPLVPPDDVGRLFQPFQRAGGGRAGGHGGLGLGLSIVGAIAAAHGAWLQASALPGGGLGVQVGFPQGAYPTPAAGVARQAGQPVPASARPAAPPPAPSVVR